MRIWDAITKSFTATANVVTRAANTTEELALSAQVGATAISDAAIIAAQDNKAAMLKEADLTEEAFTKLRSAYDL